MYERRIYSAMVSGLDIAIGQIVKKLKQEGLYENSIILFSSDVRMKFCAEGKIYSLSDSLFRMEDILQSVEEPVLVERGMEGLVGAITHSGARRAPFGKEGQGSLHFFIRPFFKIRDLSITGLFVQGKSS